MSSEVYNAKSVQPLSTSASGDASVDKNPSMIIERVFCKDDHPFNSVEWSTFDAQIRDFSGEVFYSQSNVEFPSTWSQNAVNIVASKYFYGRQDQGTRENSLKQVIGRITNTIMAAGIKSGYFDHANGLNFNHELTHLLVNQKYAFNSPVWFNIGTPERQQASACFINSVDDSMDSIMKLAETEAMIFKLGSGAGVNLSKIRGKGEPLKGGGEASGPVSFMRGYDSFAGVIKSGGKKRRAAKMIVLDVDHPDIEEFVSSKLVEEKKAHALIAAGYDSAFNVEGGAYDSVFFQNANHSVRISDAFMKAVANDEMWTLKWRSESNVNPPKQVRARDLFHKMAEAAWECGDPGVQFDDTIHTWHTCKNSGRQVATNPCSEYSFLNNTACNLGSFNLLRFLSDGGHFLSEEFAHAVRIVTIAQDILVGHADYPTPEIDKGTRKWRTLGLGYANLGALLMSLGHPYDSSDGRNIAAAITSLMCAEAYKTSSVIASHLEPFSGYAENVEPFESVILMHENAASDLMLSCRKNSQEFVIASVASDVWNDALESGRKHGYRNAQVTVLAPTGTISFMMDCDTTGIEPDIALVKFKKLVGGGNMKLVNGSVPRALKKLGYSGRQIDDIVAHINALDTIEGAPHISDEHLPVFDCAFKAANGERTISWKGHIRMMAAVQPFLSGAISKTVNMPAESTVDDIAEAYEMGWRVGLKALAIYRDGCKQSQPLTTSDNETSVNVDSPSPVSHGPVRNKLPDERNAVTHKFVVGGQTGYVTVGLYDDGSPGEVFIMMNKEGSTIAGLLDAFATSISFNLQYGVPLIDLINKFKFMNFEPRGFTPNPEIRTVTSVVDYIFRWMELRFVSGDQSNARVQTSAPGSVSLSSSAEDYGSPLCSSCGNMTQRSGSCYVCTSCGETTGCG